MAMSDVPAELSPHLNHFILTECSPSPIAANAQHGPKLLHSQSLINPTIYMHSLASFHTRTLFECFQLVRRYFSNSLSAALTAELQEQ